MEELRSWLLLPPERKQAVVIVHTDVLKCTEKARQSEHQSTHATHPFFKRSMYGLEVRDVCWNHISAFC